MMQSQKTFLNLEEISTISNDIYQEGGLTYTFKDSSHNVSITPTKRLLDWQEIGQLHLFLECALNSPSQKDISLNTINFTAKLLTQLYVDFTGFDCCVSSSDFDDYSKLLILTFVNENQVIDLELFWSID